MTHRIYAVRYGHLDRTSDQNFLGGDDHATRMPLDYYIWVVKTDERTIVVDTGFDAAAAAARGRTLIRPVEEGLAAIGVDARAVLDVVITHMHYDHAGNIALFPRARFHVQDAEMAYCTGRSMLQRQQAAPFDAELSRQSMRCRVEGVLAKAGTEVSPMRLSFAMPVLSYASVYRRKRRPRV